MPLLLVTLMLLMTVQGTRYVLSSGAGYAPYYAATPYATAAAPATGSTAGTPTAVYPTLAAAPTAIQYSMPTTVTDNGCGQQMLFVSGSTNQQADRQTDVGLRFIVSYP